MVEFHWEGSANNMAAPLVLKVVVFLFQFLNKNTLTVGFLPCELDGTHRTTNEHSNLQTESAYGLNTKYDFSFPSLMANTPRKTSFFFFFFASMHFTVLHCIIAPFNRRKRNKQKRLRGICMIISKIYFVFLVCRLSNLPHHSPALWRPLMKDQRYKEKRLILRVEQFITFINKFPIQQRNQ